MNIAGFGWVKLLSIGLLIGCLYFSPQAWAQNLVLLKKGVVVITTFGKNGPSNYGTGFIVRHEPKNVLIVTASHVVEGQENIQVEFYTQQNAPQAAQVLHMEGGDPNGLAVLSVPIELNHLDLSVLTFNFDLPVNSGDQVTILGFPRRLGIKWAVTEGQIIGRSGKYIKFSGLVAGGNSGGPLLKDNQVIGVITESLDKFSHAVPAQIAQYVLESWGVRFGATLRSKPASLLMPHIRQIVEKYGFYHPSDLSAVGLSPAFMGNFQHEYERITLEGKDIVIDRATGLMWQPGGSSRIESDKLETEASRYIGQLNNTSFAGFHDWRMPTVEELASLMESSVNNERTYIHEFFSPLDRCWTADDVNIGYTYTPQMDPLYGRRMRPDRIEMVKSPLYVDFSRGGIFAVELIGSRGFNDPHIRAVRRINSETKN